MAGQTQIAPIYPAVTESKVVIKAGDKVPAYPESETEATLRTVRAFRGYTLTEPGTAAAKVRFWDGENKEGHFICAQTLEKSQTVTVTLPDSPIIRNESIYLEIVEGSVEGSVLFD